MMDKMKDMKTKKRTLKKEEKKESETEYVIRAENVDYTRSEEHTSREKRCV